MSKLIKSGFIVLAVAAVVGYATYSFFSDTETSTGNTFTAGEIDLKIDNTSYVTNTHGLLATSPSNTWSYDDLGNPNHPHLFFSFADLKPGDIGEDTISMHVGTNDAWACMKFDLTGTPENSQPEPEAAVDPTSGTNEGELQNELNFAFWADDGDNVFETNEVTQADQSPGIFAQGNVETLFDGNYIALADSSTDVWPGGNARPIIANRDYYIAKAWCYGTLAPAPVAPGSGTPVARGTGFTCNGALVTNASQTDGIVADVTFYAEQARNNNTFLCSSLNPKEIIRVTSATMQFGPNGWAGWSCPATHPNIVGGTTNCALALTNSLAWQLGASVDSTNYPATPWGGYTYTSPTEEGWIVRNGATGQNCEILLDCQAN